MIPAVSESDYPPASVRGAGPVCTRRGHFASLAGMTSSDPSEIPPHRFEERRGAVHAALGRGAMVLPAAPVQYGSRDGERPYVADRELLYLTGATEPDTVAVLVGDPEPRFVLFVRDRDETAELWSGRRLGVEGATERFAPDACHPIDELEERLPELLAGTDRLHVRLGASERVDRLVLAALGRARLRGARDGSGPRGVVDPGEILDDLRLVKDAHEIATLRRAVEISVEAHRVAAARIAPGVGEWHVEAALDAAFRVGPVSGPAYETIVGAGANGCVLHYVAKSAVIGPDELVLVDAGAQWRYYAADITRTYPASGGFTTEQRAVYDLVDAARAAAVAVVRPGATIADVHDAATRVLAEGMVELGWLDGPAETLIEEGEQKRFFPHQTSHWLGLDVHDPGDYARDGTARVLEPGMVFTVEPGLYVAPGGEKAPAGFEGIGVRIEDDVLVTEGGHEVLTAGLPTAADEVAALVGAD